MKENIIIIDEGMDELNPENFGCCFGPFFAALPWPWPR